jgi:hypothetical protein
MCVLSCDASCSHRLSAFAQTGNDFFNEWDFFTGGDPTHGTVNFVDADTAKASNLSYVSSSGTFIMAMDTTPKVASLRNSVRITTKAVYNGGLLIMDAAHMPTGYVLSFLGLCACR